MSFFSVVSYLLKIPRSRSRRSRRSSRSSRSGSRSGSRSRSRRPTADMSWQASPRLFTARGMSETRRWRFPVARQARAVCFCSSGLSGRAG